MSYMNIENDKYSVNNNNEMNNTNGYWILSSGSMGSTISNIIYSWGKIDFTESGIQYGLRPVITVPISYLQ